MIIQYIGDVAVLHGEAESDAARTVRHSAVAGQFRCPVLETVRCPRHLGMRALHVESRKLLLVDVGEVYFNVRLSGFRRILCQVLDAPRITVIGQGVGIISLMLQKKGRTVLGLESNPRAHRLAVLNRDLNHAARYFPLLGWFPSKEFDPQGVAVFAMPRLFIVKLFQLPIGLECYAFSFCRLGYTQYLARVLTIFFNCNVSVLSERETSPNMCILLLHIPKLSKPLWLSDPSK